MAEYLACIEDGMPAYLACEACGVSRITFWKWWRLGGGSGVEEHADWVSPDVAEEPYATFVRETIEAEAAVTREIVETVSQKPKENPDFALKVLKARHPHDWSPTRKQPVIVMTQAPPIALSLKDLRRLRDEE